MVIRDEVSIPLQYCFDDLLICHLFYISADAHSTQNGGGDYRPNSAKNSGVCSLL